jgi:hypothetical protein
MRVLVGFLFSFLEIEHLHVSIASRKFLGCIGPKQLGGGEHGLGELMCCQTLIFASYHYPISHS